MRRRDRVMSALFSFYFAQCGAGLTLFFAYVMVRHQKLFAIPSALVVSALAMLIVIGLGLMTCMSIDPQRPLYMLVCVPAFGLYYLTAHVALGGPPELKLFLGIIGAALVHLLAVGLLWQRSEPAMYITAEQN